MKFPMLHFTTSNTRKWDTLPLTWSRQNTWMTPGIEMSFNGMKISSGQTKLQITVKCHHALFFRQLVNAAPWKGILIYNNTLELFTTQTSWNLFTSNRWCLCITWGVMSVILYFTELWPPLFYYKFPPFKGYPHILQWHTLSTSEHTVR